MSALLRTPPRLLIPDRKRCRDYGVVWLSGGMRGGDKLHDTSPRKQNGTLTNGPTWTKGKFGEPAISFSRASSHYVSGSLAFTANTITLAAWVNIASYNPGVSDPNYQSNALILAGSQVGSNGAFLHQGVNGTQGFRGYIYTGGTFGSGVIQSPNTPTLGAWYHVAFTYDGANVRLYENGVEVASAAQTGAIDDSTSMQLGRSDYSSGSQYLSGSLALPLVSTLPLSAKQIANLYRNPFYLYRNPPSQFNVGWAGTATTVPGAPTLSMTVSSGTLHFTWTDGATGGTPITGYKLYVGTSSGGESLKYDDVTLTAGMSSFDDSVSISDGTTYWAYLTALNAVGESAASNEVSGTPPGSSPQTITVTVASATASVSAPTVTPAATVTMPTASSTAAAIVPTVTPGATTVTPPTCSATAAASAPTLTPSVTIVSPTASATASASTPTITAGTSTITITTASATGTASAPTITPTVDIASATASATAAASPPSVSAGATTITVTTASATAAATAPDVTNATLITPGTVQATATASTPTVTPGGATIVVTTASAVAGTVNLTVTAGTTTITVGVASAVAGVASLDIVVAGEAVGSLLFTAYVTATIRGLASLQPSLDAESHLRPSVEGKVF